MAPTAPVSQEELNISKEVRTKRGVRHISLVTYEAGCMATDRLLKLIERRAKMLGVRPRLLPLQTGVAKDAPPSLRYGA